MASTKGERVRVAGEGCIISGLAVRRAGAHYARGTERVRAAVCWEWVSCEESGCALGVDEEVHEVVLLLQQHLRGSEGSGREGGRAGGVRV